MRLRNDVRDHLRDHRIGYQRSDAQLETTLHLLSSILDMVEVSMHQEGIPDYIINRAIQKVIYGALPSAFDLERRLMDERRWQRDLESRYPGPVYVPSMPTEGKPDGG